jgi:flagellar assembly protein FliH
MSRVIAKEHLTAYQRWELGSVEPRENRAPATPASTEAEEVEPSLVSLPTAAELERLQQAAWQEGYAHGHDQGHQIGFEQGTQEAKHYMRQLADLLETVENERLRDDEQLAREVLDLALVVARQMIRAALFVKEDIVVEVIREAMANLPSLASHSVLLVNPEDMPKVRAWLNAEHPQSNLRLVGDINLERGGFRVESATSEIDGAMATRWREIVSCLGTDVRWLE